MVVGPDGKLPLPWLEGPFAAALEQQRGHALLLHGAAGAGALPFGLSLAQAWLCEAGSGARPCGRCGSCRLVQSRLHPDLRVLLPQLLRRELNWLLPDDEAAGEEGKKKPSKQIRIDEVREAIDWVMKTTSRGRGKVLLLHPAEALNAQSSNALLKTLEEPPAGTRIVLSAADPAHLIPTLRSRCQRIALVPPPAEQALAWLEARGCKQAPVLLAAAGGLPLDALALAEAGVDAAAWSALPRAVARGDATAFSGWPLPRAIDALQKLCHDAMARGAGGSTRYFPQEALPRSARLDAVVQWSQALARAARHDEHPWNEGLLLDALVAQGRAT
ncbi:MAG: DNA polymerase III subunit delta', partial [Burkholderiales bacterium]|nr:DNA polymerase III subunit delta' [Burkholderiales bacterium]